MTPSTLAKVARFFRARRLVKKRQRGRKKHRKE